MYSQYSTIGSVQWKGKGQKRIFASTGLSFYYYSYCALAKAKKGGGGDRESWVWL